MNLFCKTKKCLQGRYDQLLGPRSLIWKKALSMTKETQTSLSSWNSPSPSFPLKLLC